MNVLEFIAGIGKSDPAPCVLLCPHKPPRSQNSTFEGFLATRAVERVIAEYTDPSTKDLAFNTYYGDDAEGGEIVSVAQTYPFLAARRVVIVHNADALQVGDKADALTAYLASPSEFTILVLVAPNIDRRLKLYRAFEKHGLIVECPELRGAELKDWIRKEVTRYKKKMTSEAVEQLIEKAGTSLGDVNNALTVVVNFAGERPEITEGDVLTACADAAEEEIWALTDAIAVSDSAKALRVLRQMIELGKSEFEILGTVNWLIKTAWNVASAAPGDPLLRLYQSKKVQPLVDKFGKDKLRRAFRLMIDTDLLMRSTGVDRNLAIELMVAKLAGTPGVRKQARGA